MVHTGGHHPALALSGLQQKPSWAALTQRPTSGQGAAALGLMSVPSGGIGVESAGAGASRTSRVSRYWIGTLQARRAVVGFHTLVVSAPPDSAGGDGPAGRGGGSPGSRSWRDAAARPHRPHVGDKDQRRRPCPGGACQ